MHMPNQLILIWFFHIHLHALKYGQTIIVVSNGALHTGIVKITGPDGATGSNAPPQIISGHMISLWCKKYVQ